MTRRQKEPLRAITSEERQELERISRATRESVTRVTGAKALLAVTQGLSYTAAAEACGRRSGDAVAQLVERFNREGLAALTPKHGGGAKVQYPAQQRQQILAVAPQQPELGNDGVSQWSLVTLQRRLRTSGGEELARVSTYTIRQVLHEAGYSWQNSRSWGTTGSAQRRRKSGVVTVVDPDAAVKKLD
jgi:transposase